MSQDRYRQISQYDELADGQGDFRKSPFFLIRELHFIDRIYELLENHLVLACDQTRFRAIIGKSNDIENLV